MGTSHMSDHDRKLWGLGGGVFCFLFLVFVCLFHLLAIQKFLRNVEIKRNAKKLQLGFHIL